MLQLHLGGGEVVVVQVEVGQEEALYVAFALYRVAHGREILVAVGHVLQRLAPLAVEGDIGEAAVQLGGTHLASLVVVLQQIVVVLLADVVVGDAQDELRASCPHDGQHTVVEQQAGEYVGLGHLHGGEGGI